MILAAPLLSMVYLDVERQVCGFQHAIFYVYVEEEGIHMTKIPRVVLLGNGGGEMSALKGVLAQHTIFTRVRDIPQALDVLAAGDYDALFCGWVLHSNTWREALKEIRKHYPDLPVVVVYHAAEEKDWCEVLDAGAFDLLAPPYEESMVLAILEDAILAQEARLTV
jgi:DNA-binding NtrC family response regulator